MITDKYKLLFLINKFNRKLNNNDIKSLPDTIDVSALTSLVEM